MRALMNIFNKEAPCLNKYEGWSADFRAFADDCLQKDPVKRVSSTELLSKHKKFFSQALDKKVIRE